MLGVKPLFDSWSGIVCKKVPELRLQVAPKLKPRGITRIVCSFVRDFRAVLLPGHDGLIYNIVWCNIFALGPPALPRSGRSSRS